MVGGPSAPPCPLPLSTNPLQRRCSGLCRWWASEKNKSASVHLCFHTSPEVCVLTPFWCVVCASFLGGVYLPSCLCLTCLSALFTLLGLLGSSSTGALCTCVGALGLVLGLAFTLSRVATCGKVRSRASGFCPFYSSCKIPQKRR